MSDQAVPLSSGYHMPLLGLGCWQSPPGEVELAVEAALDAGYRHIDTAFIYQNEEAVGFGLHKWLQKTGTKRSEVFVVTKLPMIGMYSSGVEKFLKKSLAVLKLDYVDLYLIHLPVGLKGKHDQDIFPVNDDGTINVDDATDIIAVWKEMEKMVDMGLTKSIGVSNYSIKQLKKTNAIARIQPSVHQVELNVYFQQQEMQEFCHAHNIILTAYAPLGSPGRKSNESLPRLLEDPIVNLVAERHGITPAQVLIRFLIQQNITTIPKSINPERIKINGDVWKFSLSELEMTALKTLDRGRSGRSFTMSTFKGMTDHPEYPF